MAKGKTKKLNKCAECDKGRDPKNFMVLCSVFGVMKHSATDCKHFKQK